MERLFDLPAHPLLVHFPVVAIPVVALAGIAMAIRPSIRDRYGTVIAVTGIVTVIATFMAAQSGTALSDALELPDDHIDEHRTLGQTLQFFVLGLGAAIGGLVAVAKRTSSTVVDQVLRGAIVGFALLSLVWVVRTGHAGATAVWDGQLPESSSEVATVLGDEPDATTTTTEAEAPAETEPEETTTTEPTTTTEAPPTDGEGDVDQAGAEAVEINAQELFESGCARCHSADGSGGRGPSLIGIAAEQPDKQPAIDIVTSGGRGMPSFGSRWSDVEIAAVVDYVYETFG